MIVGHYPVDYWWQLAHCCFHLWHCVVHSVSSKNMNWSLLSPGLIYYHPCLSSSLACGRHCQRTVRNKCKKSKESNRIGDNRNRDEGLDNRYVSLYIQRGVTLTDSFCSTLWFSLFFLIPPSLLPVSECTPHHDPCPNLMPWLWQEF